MPEEGTAGGPPLPALGWHQEQGSIAHSLSPSATPALQCSALALLLLRALPSLSLSVLPSSLSLLTLLGYFEAKSEFEASSGETVCLSLPHCLRWQVRK